MQQRDRNADPEAGARAVEAEGRRQEAADDWTRIAGDRPVGAPRARALVEQARLLAALGQRAEATLAYRRALANDAGSEAALEALFEIARTDEDWTRLAHLHRLRFEHEPEPAQRAALALEAGRLEQEHRHAPAAAQAWFQQGLEADPDRVELLEALAALERRRGDESALLHTLERLIERRGRDAAASELLEAATLRAARGEPVRALAHLERATTQAPDDDLVLEALAEVLASLERLPDLADVLERRAALADGDPELRAAVLAELGALHEERLFDPEAALDAYQRALADDPNAPGVAAAVTRLRAKLDVDPGAGDTGADSGAASAPADVEQTLRTLEREARTTNDRARLGVLVREIESLYRGRGEPEQALPWVQRWAVAAPEEPEALRALARIHERPGSEAALTATLEALDPLLELEDQASNRRAIARLYETRGLIDDAVRSYDRALAIEPRDTDTLESLAALLRDHGRAQPLIAALGQLVELRDPRLGAAALAEIATLQEQTGDLAGAIETVDRMERQEGEGSEAEERLDALLERAERYEELASRLQSRRGRHEPGSAEAVALDLRCGQIQLELLENPEAAAASFRSVLREAPESPEAKSGLERALRSSIDAGGLAEFLAEEAASAEDPERRDRAALERAVLLEETLDRGDEAGDAYRQLADEGSTPELRRDASFRLERLLERAGDWQALREHLEQSLGQGTPAEEADRHERLARLCAERLRDEAQELRHLERVVAIDPDRADVWRALGERYEDDDRVADAVEAMERELAAVGDGPRALTLHARLAALYLHTVPDPDRADAHYARVFALDPSHAAAARHLIERYESAGRPEDVLQVLEARLASIDAGPETGDRAAALGHRTALRVHIAGVLADALDDVEGAISALEVALGETGPTAQVAEPLAACYQRAGYTLDLIELCRGAAARCNEPAERANWFVRMGDAFLSRERPREAADAYHQALTERPDDRTVQASLRAIYRQLGSAEPLVGLLEAELTHLAGPDEIPVRMELAALLSGSLDRPADALLHTRRVLHLSPRHPEAFGQALDLATRQGRHETALELIETRIDHVRSPEERSALRVRRARLLSGPLERHDEAIEAIRTALAQERSAGLRMELAGLLESRERWEELVEVLGELARDARPDDRIVLLGRAVDVAWDRLSPDAALPWLERLHRCLPDDLQVVLRIAQVHRAAGRTEGLLRALATGLPLASTPTQRRDLELERAALLELEHDAPGRALSALRSALAATPGDPEVLGRIDRLQRTLGLHRDRVDTLEALLQATPEDPLALHRELAELHEGPLADPRAAVDHWRAALDAASRDGRDPIELLRALARTYRRVGDLERWAETTEEELSRLDSAPVFDDRRRELRRELTLAYDGVLARPEDALRHARALLDAGEDDVLGEAAVDQIERIALRRLREADAPLELERRLARHLGRRPDQAALWVELGRLREEQLHASAAAIDAYHRALELAPHDAEALRGLRNASERLGRWSDVADALERELDQPTTTDPARRAALLRRLGDVYWHRLESTTRASRCYAAALETHGADFAALRALERLLESMEDWRGALDLYESEIEVLGDADPQRRREIWLHVAALAGERTGEVERARRALERAAAIAPLAADQVADLADLHERADDPEAFAPTFAQWCAHPDTTPGAEDHRRLARCLESLGRPAEALAEIQRALDCAPSVAAWDDAARLRGVLGDAPGAAAALESAAARASDPEAAPRLLEAAELIEAPQPERALELLRSAALREPGCAAVHAMRTRLALAAHCFDEAETAAGHALDLDTDGALDAETALAVALAGGDAARARDRLEAAAGFYGRARELDPRDPAANEGYGESLVALGDTASAREALEARLAHPEPYPERAAHRTLLARCLEADDDLEAALAATEVAIGEDPRCEEALEVQVRVLEALGRTEDGIAALDRLASRAATPERRARALLRAARWELDAGSRQASAEAHLRVAVAADAALAPAWMTLAELLSDAGRAAETVECTDRAASHVTEDVDLARLGLLQGHAYETLGRRTEAAEAFGVAAEADPTCVEAALARARLLRGAGEWRAAAATLETFLANVPDPDDSRLAETHEQLARLLAGPLEQVNGAVSSYRRAIALSPGNLPPRAALAELLSHRAGDHEESLAHLRLLLDANPADPASLRVALRIARARPEGAGIGTGVAVLRALGVATAYENEESSSPTTTTTTELRDPLFEQLRQLVHEASSAIARALEASDGAGVPDAGDGPEPAFRAALLRAEGRLTSPALLPLPSSDLADVLRLLIELVVEGESVHGDGRRVNALSAALGRRQRRRLRKIVADTPMEQLREIDFDEWRCEVRALAAATAIAESGCDLRTALIALLRDDGPPRDELRDSANLTPLLAASPVARALLRRLVGDWLAAV